MDLGELVSTHVPSRGGSPSELEDSKPLDVALDGNVAIKAGPMVGYAGDTSFEWKSAGGLKGVLEQEATDEGGVMMQATGTGHLYLADQGKEVQVLELNASEELSVSSNDVLAFEPSVNWDIKMLTSVVGTSSGGLFNIFLGGPGHVAITTYSEPIIVPTPIKADPNATVAWSGNISPSPSRGIDIKRLLGRLSDESYQLEFAGEGGFVVVRPLGEVVPG